MTSAMSWGLPQLTQDSVPNAMRVMTLDPTAMPATGWWHHMQRWMPASVDILGVRAGLICLPLRGWADSAPLGAAMTLHCCCQESRNSKQDAMSLLVWAR